MSSKVAPQTSLRRLTGTRRNCRGMTLIELISVVIIIGILVSMGTQRFAEIKYQAQVVRAIGDIRAIQTDLYRYDLEDRPLPSALSDFGRGAMLDPWGQPYVYFPFPPANGKAPPAGARRDRFLVPINSTYDLYSQGRDLSTSVTLTAKAGSDDIVRGNDGGFIGLASRF